MKVLLHYPNWHNRWEPYILNALKEFDLTVCHSKKPEEIAELSSNADVLISMWATDIVAFWTKMFPEKKIITYCRRFELWQPEFIEGIDWSKVDLVIFVSRWCMDAFSMIAENHKLPYPKAVALIPNGVDMSEFKVREKKPDTKKIALICSMKEVKNIPMAFQIMLELPKDYTLHQIGIPFNSQHTGQILSYCYGLGLHDRVTFGGYVSKEEVSKWMADKDYVISTSLNEGNPNNIIEAMAMGIKPIIHGWPGAREQFPPDLVFDKVGGAVDLITGSSYEPQSYRRWVEDRFSLRNFDLFRDAVKEVVCAA